MPKQKNLSTAYTRELIEGWHEGFTDGVGEAIFNLARKDDSLGNNISK
jgi:hypothetical protein